MIKEQNDNKIIYVGIGVFLWLTIGGLNVITENGIKDLLLNLDTSPRIILWAKLVIQLTTYCLGFLIGIRIIKTSKKTKMRIFWNMIILFLLVQIIQFCMPLLIKFYPNENFFSNSAEFREFLYSNSIENTTVMILEFLSYLIIGIIIYKNR